MVQFFMKSILWESPNEGKLKAHVIKLIKLFLFLFIFANSGYTMIL